ncbi:hypothetical protein M9991_11000 [Chryseobacterium gallinarum]|uniref:hypothetical protein n=1 Tax=Chryseobacterium gallinarum TaxID=1324352 RepID=UPI002024407D|nr:hypothetical protein [Chryseobacterium gallinarum]MCL8537387.1 hypothetical protein [Chryseobacterium gallinarum]
MKNIKSVYYYFFYKLYNHYENNSTPWLSGFKANISLGALEIWLILSISNYFVLITGKSTDDLTIWQPSIFIPLVLLFLLHYFAFINTDIWKEYNKEFSLLPKEKNRKNGIITWSIIILIILNTIFSYYLLFSQARKDQTGPYAPEFVAKKRREDSLQKAQQIENLKKIYGEDKK